jgi:hypothetical protein
MASAETFSDPPAIRARWVVGVFIATVLLVLWCRPAVAAPSGFTFCAGELAYCELSGTDVYVTFGAGEGACDLTAGTCAGSYSPPVRYASGFSNTCRADVLGISTDPAPGVAKACYWIASGSATPPPDPASSPASSPSGSTLLTMSPAEGAAWSAAIIGVWAAAFFFRALIRALNAGDPVHYDD